MLGAGQYMRRRFSGGTYVNGRWSGDSMAETALVGSVQPMKGRDIERLPEGERSGDSRKIYVAQPMALRTADQHAGVKADHVGPIDGAWFQVVHVDDSHPLLPHTRAYLLRVTE